MKLSELKTGEKGYIVKVLGHGGFRKRIVEMGFIKGNEVQSILNAPLKDPVKYKIMGYEISLRHAEAEMIEIISEEEAKEIGNINETNVITNHIEEYSHAVEKLRGAAIKKRRKINVALVGNPNCGKTSLFNYVSGAHERVGNYSGVTVDAKEGKAFFEGYEFNIVDLPGTYSLSAYSPEELYVRKQIIDNTPDIVINVIDTSNLERNLYLTSQLIDMNMRIVCALNMYDEFENRGDNLDYSKLAQLFGVPMIPTVFKSGKGVDLLFHIIINMYEGVDFLDKNGVINPVVASDIQNWHNNYGKKYDTPHYEDFANGPRPINSVYRHIHLNHGPILERSIEIIKNELQKYEHIRHKYSTRYLAIKLLECDKSIEKEISKLPSIENVFRLRDKEVARIKEELKDDSETAIMNAKYGFIHGALQEAGYKQGDREDAYQVTKVLDRIITNKYVGFPLFFILIYIMFETTFTIGAYPMEWIDSIVITIANWINSTMPDGPLKAMIADGIIGGVGSVIVFLPQILILYAFISFMEDTGYMARAAFIMDKVMHKMGLHGKSFIPLIMGFGCNVPAITATRTIESYRSRLITMLIMPFMSCSARLPVYIMIISTFFATKYQSIIMISLYTIGILLSIVMSRIFSRWLIKGEDTPFVMELPPYRMPTIKATLRHTWEKGKQYLRKMGGIILVASIIVWALGYYPHNEQLSKQEQLEQSYIGQIGKTIEPVFKAQGFDWKLDVGLLAGVGAKEIIASTLGVLYSGDNDWAEDDYEQKNVKYEVLYKKMSANGITPLIALCYLLFVLIYFPCIAVIAAIKQESGSWKWALFTIFYTTLLAWIISALAFQIGENLIY